MAVDTNAVVKLRKSGKSNVDIEKRLEWTVQQCGWSWRSSRRSETPLTDQGAKESGVFAPLNSSKTRGKSCDETLAEAAEPWPQQPVWATPPRTWCWGTILGWSPSRCLIARSLQTIMGPWGLKNARKSSRRWPMARCLTSCSRTKSNSSSCRWKTSKWSSLGYHVIRRGKDCHQTPKSAVYHG